MLTICACCCRGCSPAGVRLTHRPTGLSVKCTDHRTQQQNRATALERLTAKLLVVLEEQQAAQLADIRGDAVKVRPQQAAPCCCGRSAHACCGSSVLIPIAARRADKRACRRTTHAMRLLAGGMGAADPQLRIHAISPGQGCAHRCGGAAAAACARA